MAVYKPSPTLAEFHRDNSFVRGIMGPIGSGKTVGMCMEIYFRAGDQAPGPDGVRRTRFAAIRNTYRELETTTLKTWHDWMESLCVTRMSAPLRSILKYDFDPPDGTTVECEVLFLALDTPQDVRHLKGLELTGAWFNEASEIHRQMLDMACGRVGRYPPKSVAPITWSGVFLDTNPPDTDHWWYRMAEETRPDGYRFWRQPAALLDHPSGVGYEVNPEAENIEHQQLGGSYWLRQASGKDPEWIKVFLKGEYGVLFDGKPVYPEYKDSVHCFDTVVNSKLLVYRGWDFGLTPACVFAQVTNEGRLVFLDELTSERSGISKFSDEVLLHSIEHFPGMEFLDVGDPAGAAGAQTDARSCFDVMRAKGIEIYPGEITLKIRLESMKRPLNTMIDGGPGMVVDPKCKDLRKGFQGGYCYRRMQISGERFSLVPDKNRYSHPHDAAQYIAAYLFGGSLRGFDDEGEGGNFLFDNPTYGESTCGY